MLFDQAMADMGVDLQMTANKRKVRREYMSQQQVAKVVQQPAQVGHAHFRALFPGHGAGQSFNDRRGVDRLLPVRRTRLRMILGQTQAFAQREA